MAAEVTVRVRVQASPIRASAVVAGTVVSRVAAGAVASNVDQTARDAIDAHVGAAPSADPEPHPGYATDGELAAVAATASDAAADAAAAASDAATALAAAASAYALADAATTPGEAAALASSAAAAAVTAHEAAGDPHPQYLTSAEGGAAYDPLGAAATSTATAAAALAAHVAAADPHTGYVLDADLAAEATTRAAADTTEAAARAAHEALTGASGTPPHGATATPGASKIPVADGSGKLDGWISAATTLVAGIAKLGAAGGAAAYAAIIATFGALANASGWLRNDGAGALSWTTPSKSDVGLGNVENTALSTWAGSSALTTLGTIATGVWNATTIAIGYGGTGLTTYALGDMLYASATNVLAKLAANATATTKYLSMTSSVPSWVTLATSGLTDLAALMTTANRGRMLGLSAATAWAMYAVFPDVFGSGRDGTVTMDGSAAVTLDGVTHTPAASVYTLTRDVQAQTLTLNSGVTVSTLGYPVRAWYMDGTGGTLSDVGNAAGGLSGGAVLSASGLLQRVGTAGGGGRSTDGTGNAGTNGTATTYGGQGRSGGVSGGGNNGGAGGALALGSTEAQTIKQLFHVIALQTYGNNKLKCGTGGGGGGRGAGGNGNTGSGGGGGGCNLLLTGHSAWAGTLNASGGNGSSAAGGTGTLVGGGGGGGGGWCVHLYATQTSLPTLTVSGGTKGNGGATSGSAGTDGDAGATWQQSIAA